jgi:hypothetical protein
MLQILVFLSITLVKFKNALTLQDSWNDLEFGMEEVVYIHGRPKKLLNQLPCEAPQMPESCLYFMIT